LFPSLFIGTIGVGVADRLSAVWNAVGDCVIVLGGTVKSPVPAVPVGAVVGTVSVELSV
ncbi:hypothetical protein GIB67_023852, partial [Kingdonia uniflora]